MTSGKLPPNPAEVLASEMIDKMLHFISEDTDKVVLDSPPTLAVTGSSMLAPKVVGVLLVIKLGVTNMAAAGVAVGQLQRVVARILGVVLDDVDLKRYNHYDKGYYHNYNGRCG